MNENRNAVAEANEKFIRLLVMTVVIIFAVFTSERFTRLFLMTAAVMLVVIGVGLFDQVETNYKSVERRLHRLEWQLIPDK